MRTFIFALIFVVHQSSASYEESIDEMLVQCNALQSEILFKNRTIHDCEKEDPDGDYSYHITSLVTRYSKRKFLCVLFFKDEFTQLNLRMLFSHGNFVTSAVEANQIESTVGFSISVLVIVPEKNAPELEILEWHINGEDHCPSCGETKETDAVGLIAGGNETDPKDWPWHLTLWKRGRTGEGVTYMCGGAILNKKWTISAAHCMFENEQLISEQVLQVRLPTGKDILANNELFKVRTLIVHEGYNSTTFEHDIALMKLEKSLDLTFRYRSVCFSRLLTLPLATSGFAIGYGSTDKSMSHSKVMRGVGMAIFDQEECRDNDFEYFNNHLFEGNFCAGTPGIQRGVCAGDSGGGFYVKHGVTWYLQGLVSNTKKSKDKFNPTCNFDTHALFTNVTFYTHWIHNKMRLY